MNRKNTLLLTIGVLLLGVFVIIGSYAFWSWTSDNNKNIVFNTSKNLENYIKYDEGESSFVGNLTTGTDYSYGIHSTISLYKTSEAANVNLMATIYMDINAIGNEMKKSSALKWTVTRGKANEIGTVLAKGNFIGANAGDQCHQFKEPCKKLCGFYFISFTIFKTFFHYKTHQSLLMF